MGWGDDLMWLGEARKVWEKNPTSVVHANRKKSIIWDDLDWVVDHDAVTDCEKIHVPEKPNGNRWYIKGWGNGCIHYQPYEPIPAPYSISDEESLWSIVTLSRIIQDNKPFVILNPDAKRTTLADNKVWGFDKWQRLCDLVRRKYHVVRLVPSRNYTDVSGRVEYDEPELEGAYNIEVDNIRDAFAIAEWSKAIVTTEGGMHHFAAARNKRAFVICGGVITPNITGYRNRNQTYYVYDHPETPCGKQINCSHCKDAMNSIHPEEIYQDICDFHEGKQTKIYS